MRFSLDTPPRAVFELVLYSAVELLFVSSNNSGTTGTVYLNTVVPIPVTIFGPESELSTNLSLFESKTSGSFVIMSFLKLGIRELSDPSIGDSE